MKIGIVKHLNARPLTFGFEKNSEHELVFENPSVLKDLLLENKLDTALISSVECLRNSESLNYSTKVGVCAKEKVRSILYFQNKNISQPKMIHTDIGSKTSVALLQVLLFEEFGEVIKIIPTNPEEIFKMIENREGNHLLFGDNALLANLKNENYIVKDLATWWFEKKQLYFVFAFWAFPKNKNLDESIFIESLEYGLKHIEEIIEAETRFEQNLIREYLKDELHYILTNQDRDGFTCFEKLVREYKIL